MEFQTPPTTDDDEGRIWDALSEEGVHVDEAALVGDHTSFIGFMTLTPDEPAQLAHARIKKAVRDMPLRSRWLLLDGLPWDSVLGDEIG